MDNASFVDNTFIVNTLVERLGPWYSLCFQCIGESFAEVEIGSCLVTVEAEHHHASESILKCDFHPSTDRSAYSVNFINHINGILAGKVRNDAGELVSA